MQSSYYKKLQYLHVLLTSSTKSHIFEIMKHDGSLDEIGYFRDHEYMRPPELVMYYTEIYNSLFGCRYHEALNVVHIYDKLGRQLPNEIKKLIDQETWPSVTNWHRDIAMDSPGAHHHFLEQPL